MGITSGMSIGTGSAGSGIGIGIALALIAVALAVAAPRAAASQARTAAVGPCPFTFQVLHNDRIGPAVLPKGHYRITLLVGSGIACKGASKWFTQFLQDYDGKLPKPWRVVAKRRGVAVFTRAGQPTFRVSRIGGGSSGTGSPTHRVPGTVCAGTFRVLHNDRIGPLRFPKGRYKLTIPRGSVVTCTLASNLFSQFLSRPAGNLPKGWSMKPTTALFFKPVNPKRKKFRVDPAL
jgi:hypothetical protein